MLVRPADARGCLKRACCDSQEARMPVPAPDLTARSLAEDTVIRMFVATDERNWPLLESWQPVARSLYYWIRKKTPASHFPAARVAAYFTHESAGALWRIAPLARGLCVRAGLSQHDAGEGAARGDSRAALSGSALQAMAR